MIEFEHRTQVVRSPADTLLYDYVARVEPNYAHDFCFGLTVNRCTIVLNPLKISMPDNKLLV